MIWLFFRSEINSLNNKFHNVIKYNNYQACGYDQENERIAAMCHFQNAR